MRWSIVLALFRRDLIEALRDRRTLVLLVLVPMLLYPMVLAAGGLISGALGKKLEDNPLKLAVWGPAPGSLLAQVEKAERVEWVEQRSEVPESPERAARALLEERKAHVVLALTPRPTPGAGENLGLELYFDTLRTESSAAHRRLDKVLAQLRVQTVRGHFERAALSPELAEPLQVKETDFRSLGMMAGRVLPYLLLLVLVMAGFYPAIDVTAGEKERGTLQTLLCAPVRPLEVVVGKYGVVLVFALGGAVMNLVGMGLAFLALGGLEAFQGVQVSAGTLGLAFGALLPLALLVSALLLSVGVLARTFKEAQNYLTPVLLLVFVLAHGVMLPGVELTAGLALVPVLNVALLLRELLTTTVSPSLFSLVFISTLAWAAAGIFFAARVFESEQVLLSGEKPWRDIFGRRVGRADGLSPGSVVLFFAVILCASLYVGMLVVKWLPLWGVVAAIQVGTFLVPAVLWTRNSGASLREVFLLRLPTPRGALAVLLLVPAVFGMRSLVVKVLEIFPPPGMDEFVRVMERLMQSSTQWPLALALAVVALAPAVCEEAAFRGVVLAGLSRTGSRGVAVVGSAVTFGLIHVYPTHVVIASALGLVLSYATLKTRSILAGVVLHFINNASVVLAVRTAGEAPEQPVSWLFSLALCVVPGAVALWLLRGASPEEQGTPEPTVLATPPSPFGRGAGSGFPHSQE
ncbi:MAG TPA: ABC transporter permease subunit/CPBP intramembrane protease [Myxococcaceae bacterium]|jgi:sodium transport system permease protein